MAMAMAMAMYMWHETFEDGRLGQALAASNVNIDVAAITVAVVVVAFSAA